YYYLVSPFDREDAPKLLPYQTGEGQFYENGEDICYGYSKLSPDELEIALKSSQLINQERDQSQRANIPQTNAQWLQQMDFLSALSHPAMIPLIDIMENRPDIYKK
ncbi:12271_t:CDS:2, partial [Gigaspora margarita]